MTAPPAGAKHASEPREIDSENASSGVKSIQQFVQYRDQRFVMDRNGESTSQTLMVNRSVLSNAQCWNTLLHSLKYHYDSLFNSHILLKHIESIDCAVLMCSYAYSLLAASTQKASSSATGTTVPFKSTGEGKSCF